MECWDAQNNTNGLDGLMYISAHCGSFVVRNMSQATSVQLRSCRVGFLRSSVRQIADVGDPSAKPQPVSLGIVTEYHGEFVRYLYTKVWNVLRKVCHKTFRREVRTYSVKTSESLPT